MRSAPFIYMFPQGMTKHYRVRMIRRKETVPTEREDPVGARERSRRLWNNMTSYMALGCSDGCRRLPLSQMTSVLGAAHSLAFHYYSTCIVAVRKHKVSFQGRNTIPFFKGESPSRTIDQSCTVINYKEMVSKLKTKRKNKS